VRGVPATCLLKSSLSREGSGPHIILGSLDPHESHSNDISICSAIFARLTRLPNTLTTLCTTTLIACVEKGLITSHQETLLPARRCASARASCGPVSVSVCVCLSQVGVPTKGINGSIWSLTWRLLSTSPTLCFKEIQVSTKMRVLPSGTFPLNFRT